MDRPWYGWCLFAAAKEARALGYRRVTAVEFGVANGGGLLCLCKHREEIQKVTGIEIVIVGFDRATGLPSTTDDRDLQYYWTAGSFTMNRHRLEPKIAGRAELVIGDVAETVPTWSPEPDAPLGMAVLDMDLYSSTAAALSVLTGDLSLPRIWCYLDDITGDVESAYTDKVGVLAAVHDFNASPERQRDRDFLLPAYCFRDLRPEPWHDQIYVYHRPGHANYNTRVIQTRHQFASV